MRDLDKRFVGTMIVALAVHSAAVGLVVSQTPPSAGGRAPPLTFIEVELGQRAATPDSSDTHAVRAPESAARRGPATAPIARAPHAGSARQLLTTDAPTAEAGPSMEAASAPGPSSSAAAAPRPTGTINIGLGRDMAWAWVTPPTSQEGIETSKPRPMSTSGGLIEALDARDRRVGLGFGGPAVSALQAAARSNDAPGIGQATFEAQFDSTGQAVAVQVLSFSSDSRGWSSVAAQALLALRSKRIRVPQGSQGVVVTLRVEVTDSLPSGADHRVAVKGAGAEFDLSDIGARSVRKVNVRIVGERRL